MANEKSRIVVLEDHPVVRDGVTELIRSDPSLKVDGVAGTFKEAVEIIRKSSCPKLVILDINLPDKRGLDAIKELLELCPEAKILVMSMYEESMLALRTVQAGASGYVMKSVTGEEILDAVRRVLAGGVYLSDAMRSQMLQQWLPGRSAKQGGLVADLTPRERQVFDRIGEGKTVKEIAAELGIGPKTVETHRAKIKQKLGVSTNTDLIRYAATDYNDTSTGLG